MLQHVAYRVADETSLIWSPVPGDSVRVQTDIRLVRGDAQHFGSEVLPLLLLLERIDWKSRTKVQQVWATDARGGRREQWCFVYSVIHQHWYLWKLYTPRTKPTDGFGTGRWQPVLWRRQVMSVGGPRPVVLPDLNRAFVLLRFLLPARSECWGCWGGCWPYEVRCTEHRHRLAATCVDQHCQQSHQFILSFSLRLQTYQADQPQLF